MYIYKNYEMNTFDIIIIALLLFGFIKGLFKGLFVEIASLLSLLIGVYGAIHFSYFVADFLNNKVQWEQKYVTIVSFAITFSILVLIVALIGKLFTKMADFASLGLLNKMLGGVFGSLKFGLILSIVFIIFTKLNKTIPFFNVEEQQQAILYEPIRKLAPILFPNYIYITDENEVEIRLEREEN